MCALALPKHNYTSVKSISNILCFFKYGSDIKFLQEIWWHSLCPLGVTTVLIFFWCCVFKVIIPFHIQMFWLPCVQFSAIVIFGNHRQGHQNLIFSIKYSPLTQICAEKKLTLFSKAHTLFLALRSKMSRTHILFVIYFLFQKSLKWLLKYQPPFSLFQ